MGSLRCHHPPPPPHSGDVFHHWWCTYLVPRPPPPFGPAKSFTSDYWVSERRPGSRDAKHHGLTHGTVVRVLSLLLPAAFFAAVDTAFVAPVAEGAEAATAEVLVSDATRHVFLQMSRGLAIILLAVYVSSIPSPS